MSFSQNSIMDSTNIQQQFPFQQPSIQLSLSQQPSLQPVQQQVQQQYIPQPVEQQILTRDGESGNSGNGNSGSGNGNSGSGNGNSGSGTTGGVSQDECTNQYPLPPSSLPTNNVPTVDETHIGVNLEFTPVVEIVINKPKIRLGNFANGSFSTKCYRT